jgi:hypothetical protein
MLPEVSTRIAAAIPSRRGTAGATGFNWSATGFVTGVDTESRDAGDGLRSSQLRAEKIAMIKAKNKSAFESVPTGRLVISVRVERR